jgi:hypothetical protein
MNEQDDPTSMKLSFADKRRRVSAFCLIALTFTISLLHATSGFSADAASGFSTDCLFGLNPFSPLLFGVFGILSVDWRAERLMINGFCVGWLTWFGVWVLPPLYFLISGKTIMIGTPNCFAGCDGPVSYTYAPAGPIELAFFFAFYLVLLCFGFCMVTIGAFFTHFIATREWRKSMRDVS